MTPFAQALSQALLHFIWEGIAVGALLWIALFLLKNRSAAARYAASCLALAALTALPPVTMWIVYAKSASISVTVPATHGPVTATIAIAASGRVDWLARIQFWALPVWSIGVLVLSIRLLWGARQVYRLRRRGTAGGEGILGVVAAIASRMGIGRRVQVLISGLADGPTVVGWIRPVILLPGSTLIGLTTEQLEAVLAHELAHIRRHDYLVNLLQMVVETLLFYHPVVWWTSSRIRQERELCCDDLAVGACGDALCYARALTVLERMRISTPEVALGGAGGPLRYRILRLVGMGGEQRTSSRLAAVVALCLALVCFGLDTHWARGQQAELQDGQSGQGSLGFLIRDDMPQREVERGVSVDTAGAQILHREPAKYPGAAVEKGIQGTVVVETTLDAAGNVVDAHVVSGPTELRKAALQSALTAHFVNQVAGSTRQISFNFNLSQAKVASTEGDGAVTLTNTVGVAYTASQQNEEADLRAREEKLRAEQARLEQARAEFQLVNDDKLLQSRKTLEFLEGQIEALAAKGYRFDHPDMRALQAKLEAGRAALQLQELQAAQSQSADQADLAGADGEKAAAAKLKKEQEAELRAKLATLKRLAAAQLVAGSVVSEIAVFGLTDSLRDNLLAKLPVHQGDTLSTDSIDLLKKTIEDFDEHLEVTFDSVGTGEVVIRIHTPGAGNGRVFYFDKK